MAPSNKANSRATSTGSAPANVNASNRRVVRSGNASTNATLDHGPANTPSATTNAPSATMNAPPTIQNIVDNIAMSQTSSEQVDTTIIAPIRSVNTVEIVMDYACRTV